jgi:hypothetical protein
MSRHQAFYNSGLWKKRRADQLAREPLCIECLKAGRAEPARAVDHCIPHQGSWNSFRTGKLQSLCFQHHNSGKKREENRGFSCQIDAHGIPVDERHPFHTGQLDPPSLEDEPFDPLDLIG